MFGLPDLCDPPAGMATQHRWKFFRAGGVDQVKLTSGKDLLHLGELDQKLWVALACPTAGLEFDARTAELIDTDKDGRIRVSELLAALRFAGANLKDPDALLRGAPELALDAIEDGKAEGATLRSAAEQVLVNLGRPHGPAITVEDLADTSKLFANTAFNGDGVIIPESAADEPTRKVIDEVIACVGSVPDRSGKPGIGETQIADFFTAAAEYDAWYAEAEAKAAVLWPLGAEGTAVAAAAVAAVRRKVDDYFARCRVAAFDPRTVTVVNRNEEAYLEIVAKDLTVTAAELSGFPLARVEAGRPLPLAESVNPAYAAALEALRTQAIRPLLGDRAALSESDWRLLLGRLAEYEAWQAGKRGSTVEPLGIARIRALVTPVARETLMALVAQDRALEPQFTNLENLERLVRYHRDLFKLCNNFVNFEDFYDGGDPAIFQTGTLYLDQRSCKLCLPVDDAAKHALMAGLAGAYLAYVDCVRKATGEKRQIVAAFTDGDSDNLMVGRNGIFYDRQGRDWDATITRIVDNPISVRQAFWSPYKKFVRLIEEQVAKRAAAAESESHKKMGDVATATVHADKTAPAAPVEPKKLDIGSVAAIGVAFGAIGSFLTAVVGYTTGLFKMGVLATIGAFVVVICLISLPSVVLAYIKLRKRNLGPILDANGWAVNARARINVPFGASLTEVAKLPRGARRDHRDPFAEKRFPLKRLLALGALLYLGFQWYGGHLDGHLPERLRSRQVLGEWAPQPPPGPPAPAAK
jgi:hypothetical protein